MNIRAIHTIPSVAKESSGPSYTVRRLCESLLSHGVDATMAALKFGESQLRSPFLITFPLGVGPRRLGRSPAMAAWLSEQVSQNNIDVIHNHGMWQMNSVYPGAISKKFKINYVVSPRGSFSEWAMKNGSFFKSSFWKYIQRPSLSETSCFHATSHQEYEDVRRLGFRQPIAIIPNGIDIPPLNEMAGGNMRTLLFLGRLHKKKGLEMLLSAWRAVEKRFPEWRLCIAGSDTGYYGSSGYAYELQTLAVSLGLERIEFIGELNGEQKLKAYQESELFILPTYSENFGMTVAEALASGTPVIVTQGAPWGGLEDNCSGWWIETSVDALVAALEIALSYETDVLAAMGASGRAWMEREYSWDEIGYRMQETYKWLRDGGNCPSWVKID